MARYMVFVETDDDSVSDSTLSEIERAMRAVCNGKVAIRAMNDILATAWDRCELELYHSKRPLPGSVSIVV
jgi:hypothetical protein